MGRIKTSIEHPSTVSIDIPYWEGRSVIKNDQQCQAKMYMARVCTIVMIVLIAATYLTDLSTRSGYLMPFILVL